MTARPDGTALWLRGTNEVVDGKEGLPPSISPPNTSCRGLRDPLAPTVAWNSAGSTLLCSSSLACARVPAFSSRVKTAREGCFSKVKVGNLVPSGQNGLRLNR